MSAVTMAIEVITLPVDDVDRAKEFYIALGFELDVDYAPTSSFRVVQLTPPGSAASIQFGVGLTDAAAGSVRNTYLLVEDLEKAKRQLARAGVQVSGIRHKAPVDTWTGGFKPGLDAQRTDYASFVSFADLDGNTWTVQERGFADKSR
jgi:catechol 2,3-dioxygenase-like lactoylglutathione lyase family enzyme